MAERAECRDDRGPCLGGKRVGVVPGRELEVVAAGDAREVERIERRVHPRVEEHLCKRWGVGCGKQGGKLQGRGHHHGGSR